MNEYSNYKMKLLYKHKSLINYYGSGPVIQLHAINEPPTQTFSTEQLDTVIIPIA